MKTKLSVLIMLVLILIVSVVTVSPTSASTLQQNNQQLIRCASTGAYGYGLDSSWRVFWQHSNYLRVSIPTNQAGRIMDIYYDGQRVGPGLQVSWDIRSNGGDPYTDLDVSTLWAGYKWSSRDPNYRHWQVVLGCYV
jgi:hypothetical protein